MGLEIGFVQQVGGVTKGEKRCECRLGVGQPIVGIFGRGASEMDISREVASRGNSRFTLYPKKSDITVLTSYGWRSGCLPLTQFSRFPWLRLQQVNIGISESLNRFLQWLLG